MAYVINGKTFPTKMDEILTKEEYRKPLESFLTRVWAVENFHYLDARRKKESIKDIYHKFLSAESLTELGSAGNILGPEISELASNFKDNRWPEKLRKLDKAALGDIGGRFAEFLKSKEFKQWCFSALHPKTVATKIGVNQPKVIQDIGRLIVAIAAGRSDAETLAAGVIKDGKLKLSPRHFVVVLKKKDGWLRIAGDALGYAENKAGRYVFRKGQARLGSLRDFSSDKSKRAFEHLVNLYLKNQVSAAVGLYKKLQKEEPALKSLSFEKMIKALETARAFA